MRTTTLAIGLLSILANASAAGPPEGVGKAISLSDGRTILSPYVWKLTGEGDAARAEATMPGAYLKAAFRGSESVGLLIDGHANHDCPSPSMPVIEASVDSGPFRVIPLTRRDEVYALGLAEGLDRGKPHRLEVFFRASDLTKDRWTSPKTRLRLAGLRLDEGGTTLEMPARPRRAIGFGDSITEGVGVDGLFKSWESLEVNNARASWLPVACEALGCEYGQLGTGGHGMSRPIQVPPLNETWDKYDSVASRLVGGSSCPSPITPSAPWAPTTSIATSRPTTLAGWPRSGGPARRPESSASSRNSAGTRPRSGPPSGPAARRATTAST